MKKLIREFIKLTSSPDFMAGIGFVLILRGIVNIITGYIDLGLGLWIWWSLILIGTGKYLIWRAIKAKDDTTTNEVEH